MENITAIIVDDELSAREVLENLLSKIETITILEKCVDVVSAVEKIKELKPDVVFLDVQMPNYAGYEIVNFFDKIDFEIIFVTAYDNYAIKAFEISAIDYLVKPINRIRLSEAILKLEDKLEKQNRIEDYKNLLESIKDKEFKKIIIPELGNKRIIKLNDIIAIEALGAYSKIFIKDQKAITTSKNLSYYENLLTEELIFFRSHRAWIINFETVTSFNKKEMTILHNNGVNSRLSRQKKEEFESIFTV